MATSTTNAIRRELRIAARPETVFALLTRAEEYPRWMGRQAWIDARPGGMYRVDYNGFDIARGEFVEVVPNSRVVFTWGWETLEADGLRPGASRVEFTLEPDGDGTLLRMVHTGLSEAEAASHREGWDLFLPFLGESAVSGKAVQPAAAPLGAAEEMASRLNGLLVEAVGTIEQFPAARWTAVVAGDGRSANVVADHIAGHFGLVEFARATAAGERFPLADLTGDALEAMNAGHARDRAGATAAEVVAAIREGGPAAVETLKAIPDAGLARTQAMAFAGGAELSAAQLIEGPLLGDIRGHLDNLRAAAR